MKEKKFIPEYIREVLVQCKVRKDAVCVIDGNGRETTYGEFLECIKKVALYFREKGIGRKEFVVINLPNAMEYLAVEYATWLSGCTIVPSNIMYPKERVDYLKNHCDASLVVDMDIMSEINAIEVKPDTRFDWECEKDGIAAIFYTSGSTGTPKGVIHTFESMSHIERFEDLYEVKDDDCFGFCSTMSFVSSFLLIPYMRKGARIRFYARETITDIELLLEAFRKDKVTCTFFGPAILRQVDLTKNTDLRLVITGTERISNIAPQANYKLVSLYGMTETSPLLTYFVITKPYDNTPVGKPFSDIELKLEEDGEICARGPVSPGYYKDPEKSAKLWRGGWLHTGDIGRMLPDGNLDYVNRKDWMCKINGQRVETGEVTVTMTKMKGVKAAAVKAFTQQDGQQYLVGYYVGDGVDDDGIRKFLSERLPLYMIPSYFVKMDALPLTQSGKLDMNSLQSPVTVGLKADRKITPPRTELEKKVCSAFETALGMSPIGIDDDFFDMGGDSIRVMKLQNLCSELKLSARMIYQYRTVSSICENFAESSEVKGAMLKEFGLSKTQEGIFVECMKRQGEKAYNNPYLIRLGEEIDMEKMEHAIEAAVMAHDGLFTEILMGDDGMPMQRLSTDRSFSLMTEKMTTKQFEVLKESLEQPFNILKDRLFRIRLIETETDKWLFTDFHHIIYDGSSNEVFISDIETAYAGEKVEKEEMNGLDIATEEAAIRDTDFYVESKQWYLKEFGEVEQTSLPMADRNSEAITFSKANTSTGITSEVLAKAASSLGVTENVLALTAFGYMLGACNHAKESAFATIYNGRKELSTQRTIAMMVKTLPVWMKWEKDTRLGDMVQKVKTQLTGCMAHDIYSFAELCTDTAIDSRMLFTYQDELLERNTLCGAPCTMTSLLDNATGEPIAIQLYKKDGMLHILTEYRSNMFSEKFIKRLNDSFCNVLRLVLQMNKSDLCTKIGLVDETTEQSLIKTGTGKTVEYDRSKTIIDMFRKHVSERPDATAVVDEASRLTYAELDRRTDLLAGKLAEMGVKEEDFVGLMLDRRKEFTVGYMSAYKAGAAYVPMDYEYPIDRLQYMLEDSEAKVLITTHGILDEKKNEGEFGVKNVLFIDDIDWNEEPEQKDINHARPEGLAYMIYTSGTTGRPKGVMIEHRAMMNWMHCYRDMGRIEAGTRLAAHPSFSFDASVCDLMTALAFGAELHILGSELRKDLSGMYRYFNENKIEGMTTSTQIGVTMMRMFDLSLRFVLVGGEKLAGKFDSKTLLINGYGPTEFTVCSSFYPIDNQEIPENIPIGKAVPNTISAIVDPMGRLMPMGMAGELVLVGPQIARGYWHREDITKERFEDCPFMEGQKMYHTGDLARWSEDGELLFMGRIDTQVKLRGFRIELGEIESTMAKYEGVRNAVVAVKEIGGVQHLCGYYCSDEELDNDKMKEFMAASLTDYMVPTALMRLETMPMTPNGKIDIKKLPLPEIKAEEIVEPEGETEQKLFDMAAENLKTRDFGVTTNLISMGMTSMGAIALSVMIEKKTGWTIPSSKMMEMPTIRQWKELVEKSSTQKETVKSYPTLDYYPMTENQVGVYLDWEQHRDSLQYNIPILLKFEDIDGERIQKAADRFLVRHEYLGVRLEMHEGKVMQKRSSLFAPTKLVMLPGDPGIHFWQNQVRPFDLLGEGLCRMTVFQAGRISWLLADIHHIIFDGGSESILMQDIISELKGEGIQTEEFTAYDYSLLYKEWQESEEFGKAADYFDHLISGTTSASLSSVEEAKGSGAGNLKVNVERDGIRTMCRQAGVTENAFFIAAVMQTLHRLTRENDLNVVTVSNGRSLSTLTHATGMFVQTLPVVSHNTDRTVTETIQAMQRQIIDSLSRDKYPFTKLVEKHGIKPQIMVVYQGDVVSADLNIDGREVDVIYLSSDTAKFPISVSITPTDNQTELQIEYDKAIYSAKDIEIFANAVKALAENMSHSAGESIRSVACVSEKETEELILVGQGEKLDVDASATIVSMFRKHAKEAGDLIAVVDENGGISYRELDRMSDKLAHELYSRGVKEDTFVALMLPRTRLFPVAFMSVFKSGGAYVPMDCEYPIDRLLYMIENSEAKVMITTHAMYEEKRKEGEFDVENVLFIDDFDFCSANDTEPIDLSQPDGLAYMIYTSGTTGKPKGVMIEHRCVVNMATWEKKLKKLDRGSKLAQHASFSFDASIIDLMPALIHGCELHIVSESMRKDPEMLAQYLNENQIYGMTLSTQLGMMLLSQYDLKLSYLMMGGEKLSGKYDTDVTIINGYGPTEFTVCSSYYAFKSKNTPDNIPIGKAVANTWSEIVDAGGNLLPRGAAGELVLIGPQIARGYWHRDDVTREKFVDCPFMKGHKMYRTGDLVRWNDEGELLFMGRIDTQVKLRGFRIELGEVESAVKCYDGVTSAVAVVKEINGVQHLCAYYTALKDIKEDELTKHLSSFLTGYMVPDAVMRLDTMPLTPNGKIDTKKLPEPKLAKATEHAFEPVEGETETKIAEAFSNVLGTDEKIGRNSSFFLLGGTSLMVMKLIMKLAEAEIKVTYGDIFKYPTPRTLAAFLEGYQNGYEAASQDAVPVKADETAEEEETVLQKGADGYDYTVINNILKTNTIENVGDYKSLNANELGDVLLLGATGYLGVHILDNLLRNFDGKVFCMIRQKDGVSGERRLKSLLMYYFDNPYTELFGSRLFVIEGDMTDDDILDKLNPLKVDTVINCAANVKHFAAGDEIEKINQNGAEKMIDFCMEHDARLIHTSTHSISGVFSDRAAHPMGEDELFFGQDLITKYQQSKFHAERAILEAVGRGLKAKIMRLGNLMPRYSDGEFQINMENNGFMARMRAYVKIGYIPSSHLKGKVEMAPIDQTADAILKLSKTPDKFTVFHPFNNHDIYIDDIIAIMRRCGLEIHHASEENFQKKLMETLADEKKNPFVTTLLAYGGHSNYIVNPPKQDFTTEVLYTLDWRWKITGDRYLADFINKLIGMAYFDK